MVGLDSRIRTLEQQLPTPTTAAALAAVENGVTVLLDRIVGDVRNLPAAEDQASILAAAVSVRSGLYLFDQAVQLLGPLDPAEVARRRRNVEQVRGRFDE